MIFDRFQMNKIHIFWISMKIAKNNFLQFRLFLFRIWWLSTKTHQKRTKSRRKVKNENDSKLMWCRVKVHRMMCIRAESAPRFKFRIHIVYDWCATLIWQISLHMYKNVCVSVCLCWSVCAHSIFSFVYRLSDHCYIKHFIKSKFRVSFTGNRCWYEAKQHEECYTGDHLNWCSEICMSRKRDHNENSQVRKVITLNFTLWCWKFDFHHLLTIFAFSV